MTGDLRGFTYVLDPVRQKAQWQLDTLQRELAIATARVAALRQEAAALSARLAALAHEARSTAAAPINPSLHHQRLAYLADAQRRLTRLAADLSTAEATQADGTRRVSEQQLALDAINDDRERSREAYAAERQRVAAIEADDDWLTRAGWRQATVATEVS
ncbi:hypothetical protein SAMN05216359_10416 [Roseateles sp. YR242]|uniref:hypothetical protein n=1 Tax=Roseateles sp. YR242 TaxID=1855305 RepID=UPI0008C76F31|nr:hypothetical protein [Roseateles sp. YR242]SEK92980.1 hypothetical protein SAMN05216359_10416 [Roseateles sp. YR242]